MKSLSRDFRYLRAALLSVLLAVLLGGGAIWRSYAVWNAWLIKQQDARQRLATAEHELSAVKREHTRRATLLVAYQNMQARRVIGDEPRLDWVEGLEKIRGEKRTIHVNYSISPQMDYLLPAGVENQRFSVRQSMMQLQLDVLHERQLLDFLHTIRTGMPGYFLLEQCRVARLPLPPGGETKASARLAAECSGSWISLTLKQEAKR